MVWNVYSNFSWFHLVDVVRFGRLWLSPIDHEMVAWPVNRRHHLGNLVGWTVEERDIEYHSSRESLVSTLRPELNRGTAQEQEPHPEFDWTGLPPTNTGEKKEWAIWMNVCTVAKKGPILVSIPVSRGARSMIDLLSCTGLIGISTDIGPFFATVCGCYPWMETNLPQTVV